MKPNDRVLGKLVYTGICGFAATLCSAANSTWTGAADGCWTNAANWTAGVPGRYYDGSGTLVGSTAETATFSDCSGATTIDLDGVHSIGKLLVTGAAAPRYTFGTSSTQILPIEGVWGGSLNQMVVDASVTQAPVVVARLRMGVDVSSTDSNNGTRVYVYNNSADTLVINDFGDAQKAAVTGSKLPRVYCTFRGSGPIRVDGRWVLGTVAANQSYISSGSGADGGPGPVFTQSFEFRGFFNSEKSGSKITIAEGATIEFQDGNAWGDLGAPELIVDGLGTMSLLAKQFVQCYTAGKIKLNCRLALRTTPSGNEGLIVYGVGTYCPTCGDNSLSGKWWHYGTADTSALELTKIGCIGEGPLNNISTIAADNYFTLRFTGTEPDVTDRQLEIGSWKWNNAQHSYVIDQSGTASITFNNGLLLSSAGLNGVHTLKFTGSTAADGIFNAVLADGASTQLKVDKTGTGRWVYTAAMTYTGATTVEAGTLALGSGGSLVSSPVTLSGGTLAVTAAEAKTLLSLDVSADSAVELAGGATLTLAAFTRSAGTLAVTAGAGASITCAALAGQRPVWITLNGDPVEFNAQGLMKKATYAITTEIAARGDTVPNSAGAIVGITTDGTGGADVLAADATAVGGLVQKTAAEAVMTIGADQTLTTSLLAVDEEGGALTVGATPGIGTVVVPGNALTFDAGSAAHPITLNATLDPLFAGTVVKRGAGELKWTSPIAFSSTLDIGAGLVSAVLGADGTFAATLTGSEFGSFRADGSGTLTVTSTSPDYDGAFTLNGPRVDIALAEGTVRKFGSATGDLYVTNGASLHLVSTNYSSSTCANLKIGPKNMHFSGSGSDGTGAFVSHEYFPFFVNRATLDGDTTFSTTAKEATNPGYLVFSKVDNVNPRFNMNGHTLDYVGNTGYLAFNDHCVITNAGRINVRSGTLAGYSDADLGGPEADPISLGPGTTIHNYAIRDIRRKLEIKGTSAGISQIYLQSDSDPADTNVYRISGPVAFAPDGNASGCLVFSQNTKRTNATVRISGKITGTGELKGASSFVGGDVMLENPTNDFSGPVTATAGGNWAFNFLWPKSPCRDYADVVVPGGYVALWAPNWEAADILQFANKATLQNYAVAAVNTSLAPQKSASIALSDSDIVSADFGLGHSGEGRLSLTGSWTQPISLGAFGGTLELAGAGSRAIKKISVTRKRNDVAPTLAITGGSAKLGTVQNVVGRGQTWMTGLDYVSRLRVENATLSMPDDSSGCSAPAITFGYGCEAGVLEIGPGADVSLFAYFGQNVNNAGGAGVGAVVQTGGKFTGVMRAGQTQDRIFIATGDRSWGAWELEGGEMDLKAAQQTRVGFGQYASGVIHQSGGTAKFSQLMLGDSAYGSAAYLLMGGTATATGIQMPVISWNAKGFLSTLAVDNNASLTINNGLSTITVANGNPQNGTVDNGTTAIIDLLGGGRLFTKGFTKYNTYNILPAYIHAYVNFDGGVLQLGGTSPTDAFSSGEWVVDRVVSYGRGAEIEVTAPQVTGRLYAPITAPSGSGVSSVAWAGTDAAKRRYLGTPSVDIVGDGTGASAMAVFDRATERVTGIRILAPGCDYTHAVAVIRADAQSTYRTPAWFTNACTLAANGAGGGLTVSGQGTVEMYATNTYSGATVLKGGTLKLMGNDVIKSGMDLVLAGGTLDLNGKTAAFGTVSGSGTSSTVKNGTLVLTDANWTVDCADLVAGRYANVAGNVSFPANAKVSFVNCNLLDENKRGGYPVFQTSGTVSNMPTLEGTLPRQWQLVRSGGRLKLIYANALAIIFR